MFHARDDDEIEYSITLRWLLASILTLLVSLAIAGITMAEFDKH